jgi:ribosomal protein S13
MKILKKTYQLTTITGFFITIKIYFYLIVNRVLKINIFFNFIFLFYRYLLNNKLIDLDENLNTFILNNYGFSKKTLSKIEERIENNSHVLIKDLNKNEWEHFLKISYYIIPFSGSFFKKRMLNIAFLDLLTTYRGWRHLRGLPVRGQRTWTNAWSVYKSNNVLRNFKIKMSKKFYGSVPVREANIAYSAEYVNLLWKIQWEQEWILAKNHRLKFSGHKNTMKIDLYSMANYQVMHPLKLKNLSKKQKQSFKKNYFSLGFDPGFTKILIKSMFHTNDSNSDSDLLGSSLILRDERLNRKRKK